MNYNYNTYKEILQQPKVWLKTLDSIRAHKQEIKDFKDKYLNDGYQVVLTGAGTSAYIGDALFRPFRQQPGKRRCPEGRGRQRR